MSNTITSDEVNYLVFRYLQECGYVHSAYAFGHESRVLQSGLDGSGIPPGALLSFLQRGVSYAEIEARVAQRGSAAGATADAAKGTDSAAVKTEAAENGLHQALEGALFAPVRLVDVHRVLASNRQRTESSGAGGGRGAGKTEAGVAIAGAPRGVPYAIQESEVTTLYGHTAEVFVIAWNPQRAYLLASGSGDATARLWAIPSGPCGRTAVAPPLELRHYGDEVPLADADAHPAPEESVTPKAHGGGAALSRDVTAVTWSPDGLRLATSSYDGIARIWSDAGLLERRLALHSGPVLSLKWNRSGTRLLTSSVDHTVAVWRAADATATCEQQFTCHRAPALDVDWQSDDTFASSGSDKMVYVCKVGDAQPLRVFYGHQDEVNSVEWDPTGTLLASGSDDCTVKVWKPIRDGTSGTEPVAAIGGVHGAMGSDGECAPGIGLFRRHGANMGSDGVVHHLQKHRADDASATPGPGVHGGLLAVRPVLGERLVGSVRVRVESARRRFAGSNLPRTGRGVRGGLECHRHQDRRRAEQRHGECVRFWLLTGVVYAAQPRRARRAGKVWRSSEERAGHHAYRVATRMPPPHACLFRLPRKPPQPPRHQRYIDRFDLLPVPKPGCDTFIHIALDVRNGIRPGVGGPSDVSVCPSSG
eukprot:ctg_588.g274